MYLDALLTSGVIEIIIIPLKYLQVKKISINFAAAIGGKAPH